MARRSRGAERATATLTGPAGPRVLIVSALVLDSRDVSRRTKIVCTIGPATASPDRIRELVQAGMDVARLNFSHGDRDDHKRVYDMVRQAADSEGHAVGILADLQGPKIRLGRFARGAGANEWRPREAGGVTRGDRAGT